ncbi:MAG: ABC transporter substrate-binding protein, partial [Stellaceae bacterium]
MRLRCGLIAGLLVALVLAAMQPAAAETNEIRIARQYSLAQLPLMVMEKRKLIERQAEIMGLGAVRVTWVSPDKRGVVDMLLAGRVDLAPVGIGHFIIAHDRKIGTPEELGGLAALTQAPYVLVTRNPSIKTILDFTDKDRIAVPELKTSGPALMLEMAAAQEWGIEHYDKLDPLVRARSDAEASFEMREGRSEIDTHFSRSPDVDDELGTETIHRVMDSYDIAGPHSDNLLVSRRQFAQTNPKLCVAIFAALQEADEFIQKNRGEAAELYVSMVGEDNISVEDFTDLIGDPDVAFTPAPAG